MQDKMKRIVSCVLARSLDLLVERDIIREQKAASIREEFNKNTQVCYAAEDEKPQYAVILSNPQLGSDQELISAPIIIRISRKNDRYLLYHEIAHYISASPLLFSNDGCIRRWGIGWTEYRFDGQPARMSKFLYALNETLTDCLGVYLFRSIEGKDPPQYAIDRVSAFADVDLQKMFRLYLDNDTQGTLAYVEIHSKSKCFQGV